MVDAYTVVSHTTGRSVSLPKMTGIASTADLQRDGADGILSASCYRHSIIQGA